MIGCPQSRIRDCNSPELDVESGAFGSKRLIWSECLNQMHKEEKRIMKEKRKTNIYSSKSSRISDTPENSANSSSATAKSRLEYMREYRARKKTLQNTLLMPSSKTNEGNVIETFNDSTD
ncbi:hypothetical protein TNCV_3629971 [Trichonephila clavipes]|nr:hypothetical protein TNCV_3629971 [Trichonephila clavipes]